MESAEQDKLQFTAYKIERKGLLQIEWSRT